LPDRIEDAMRVAADIPNARFIFIKRDIEDNCLRIFMRNYKRGNFYASDLRDIRDHLTFFNQMIDALAAKLPQISRVVTYENLVADPTAALAEAAHLCNLDVSIGAVPSIGDDRGCAVPYRDHIETALRAAS
jgi:hypothetical protein